MEVNLNKLDKIGITINQFYLMIALSSGIFYKCIDRKTSDVIALIEKGLIKIYPDKAVLRMKGINLLRGSGNSVDSEDIDDLAEQMRSIFPQGNKHGTTYRWRGTKAEITKKINSFLNKYSGFSKDEIIEATKRYVDSFNGVYTYMQLLGYFIEKNGTSRLLEELEALREGDNEISSSRETSI